jgi:hypothetical protein
MKSLLIAFTLLSAISSLAQPATAPATETLLKGDFIFTPPDGWKLEGKADDGRRARYSHADPGGQMEIIILQQEAPPTNAAAVQIGQAIAKKLRDNANSQGFKLLMPPKVETDTKFYLRVHYKYAKEAEVAEQVAVYRVMGFELASIITTVFGDSPDEIRLFEAGEKTLLGAKMAREVTKNTPRARPATRPTVLSTAKITFNAPAGWDEQLSDNSSGIVATYHDPTQRFNTIIITVRPLPAEAKKDPKIRDAMVDEIVSGEKTQFKFDGAQAVGETEIVKDRRFIRKERIRYERTDAKIQVTARQLRIGDAVVSVAMAALDQSAADLDKLADEVALTVKAAR